MRWLLLIALLALGAWGMGYAALKMREGQYRAEGSKELYAMDYRGSKMPDLNVRAWLTKQPKLEEKVVLVDFWATWCGPCRAAIPELNALQERFKDDLVVIGISDETPDVIEGFRQQVAMNYFVGTDPMATAKRTLGVEGIPNVFILSTDGVVRWQGVPMMPQDRLTVDVVKGIIDADPGIAKRHAAEKLRMVH